MPQYLFPQGVLIDSRPRNITWFEQLQVGERFRTGSSHEWHFERTPDKVKDGGLTNARCLESGYVHGFGKYVQVERVQTIE